MRTFKEWLKVKESSLAGTYAIVSCKDLNNPNFQISGAMSDLNCGSRKKRSKKRKPR